MGKEHILLWALVAMTAIAIYLAIALWRVARRRKTITAALHHINTMANIIKVSADIEADWCENDRIKSLLKGFSESADVIKHMMPKMCRLTKCKLPEDQFYINALYWLSRDWKSIGKGE